VPSFNAARPQRLGLAHPAGCIRLLKPRNRFAGLCPSPRKEPAGGVLLDLPQGPRACDWLLHPATGEWAPTRIMNTLGRGRLDGPMHRKARGELAAFFQETRSLFIVAQGFCFWQGPRYECSGTSASHSHVRVPRLHTQEPHTAARHTFGCASDSFRQRGPAMRHNCLCCRSWTCAIIESWGAARRRGVNFHHGKWRPPCGPAEARRGTSPTRFPIQQGRNEIMPGNALRQKTERPKFSAGGFQAFAGDCVSRGIKLDSTGIS